MKTRRGSARKVNYAAYSKDKYAVGRPMVKAVCDACCFGQQ